MAGASARASSAGPRSSGCAASSARGCGTSLSVPWIWTGIAAATVILMVAMAPFTALLPRVVQVHYHRGVGSYGAIFSAMAAGMVVGSLVWARWHPARHRVLVCFASFGINDIGIVVLALSPWYPLAIVAAAWRGLWIGIGISAWTTLMSELVPERLLSRASSIDFFGSIGLTPVGYVLAGGRPPTVVAPTTILAVGGALGAAALVRAAALAAGADRGVNGVWSLAEPDPLHRGAQIRTGDLSDPNGARYQAAPHPEIGA